MNSVLVILNDHLHHIRDDPEFGRKVYEAVGQWPRIEPRATDDFRVVSIAHADFEQIVSVSHGRGTPLPVDETDAIAKQRRKRARQERANG